MLNLRFGGAVVYVKVSSSFKLFVIRESILYVGDATYVLSLPVILVLSDLKPYYVRWSGPKDTTDRILVRCRTERGSYGYLSYLYDIRD